MAPTWEALLPVDSHDATEARACSFVEHVPAIAVVYRLGCFACVIALHAEAMCNPSRRLAESIGDSSVGTPTQAEAINGVISDYRLPLPLVPESA